MAGRYDKVKVWHDGQLKTPTNIAVYNNYNYSYLGAHTDTGTNTVAKVRKDGQDIDFLKHPKWIETPAIMAPCNVVVQGLPLDGLCFCPTNKWRTDSRYTKTIKNACASHWFQGYISKDTNEDVVVFETYDTVEPQRRYYRLTWQADGRMRCDIGAKEPGNEGCVTSATTTNAIMAGEVAWLDTYAAGGPGGMYYSGFQMFFCKSSEAHTAHWVSVGCRSGNTGQDASACKGQYSFNVGWVNANATNVLGDYAGMKNGWSRLHFHGYAWVGGSQISTGQHQLFMCNRGRSDEYKLTPVNVLTRYATTYQSKQYLDDVVKQEASGYWDWQ